MCILEILIVIVSLAMIAISLRLLMYNKESYANANDIFKNRVLSLGYGYPVKSLNYPAELLRLQQVIRDGQFSERTIGDISISKNLNLIKGMM